MRHLRTALVALALATASILGQKAEKTAVPMAEIHEVNRLIPVRNDNTGSSTGLCLEVHDLAVSKLIAGREKDLNFIGALLRHNMADGNTIAERLNTTSIPEALHTLSFARLQRLQSS